MRRDIKPNATAWPPASELPGVPIQCDACSYGVNVLSVETCARESSLNQGKKAKQLGCLYCWEETRHSINILAICIASVITAFFVWWSIHNEVEFNLLLHISLCTTGTMLFSTMGILMFAGDHCFGQPYKKSIRACVHGYCMFVAFLLVLGGVVAHILGSGGLSFTAHALVGFAGVIAMIVAIFFGIFAAYAKRCSCVRPACCKFLHIFVGIVSYVVCLGSLCLELQGDWFTKTSTTEMFISLLALIGIAGGYTIIAAFFTMMYYFMLI